MSRLQSVPEYGVILTLKDGIASVSGLSKAFAGELVYDELGNQGMALNLERSRVGVVMFSTTALKAGSILHRTYKLAQVIVGPSVLMAVVNSLGERLNADLSFSRVVNSEEVSKFSNFSSFFKHMLFNLTGLFKNSGQPTKLVESKATGILARQSVNESLYTGITAVDSVIPIGRGQRELLIGDRQTGKTALGFDAMLNQRSALL